MILIIDNYDSFTFNLYQFVGSINQDVLVKRNDKITVEEIAELKPSHIILSPGPGYPKDAGICEEVLQNLKESFPIMGVCLGHQAIGEVFGGTVVPAPQLVHGKQSKIKIKGKCKLVEGLHESFLAARYHSLVVEKEGLPEELIVAAETEDGEIMAVKHRDYEVYGVQFHPESIMTPDGMQIIKNFLSIGVEQ
ncbi:MAG: aminodeoxychorismate/anthranilate synthase component II [Acholeplasmataceae bacterium]|nr:aminodeoxychorismate/anthranilate synthase component II [Acholeplasmataceae bacterium]